MIAAYQENLTVNTFLYPGVADALAVAKARTIKCAVVTNKPIAATRAILAHFGILGAFETVIGGDEGIPRKPEPDPLWVALDRLGVRREDAVMVGDSAQMPLLHALVLIGTGRWIVTVNYSRSQVGRNGLRISSLRSSGNASILMRSTWQRMRSIRTWCEAAKSCCGPA